MAKNNALINAAKAYRKQFDKMIPMIYASFAIALSEEGFGYKRIARVFCRSQELWQEAAESPDHGTMILKKCSDELGIDVMYGLNSTPDSDWKC